MDAYGFDVYYRDPLNRAHFLQRKAEACLNCEKYDEAISLHKQAAEDLRILLRKLQKGVPSANAVLSLQLQIEEHYKQEALIGLRKKQNNESKLRRKNWSKYDKEPFQDITYSNSSIESYDSSDYISTSTYTNDGNSEYRRKDDVNKWDDMISKMVVLIKQQQMEILSLSKILQEKDKENQKLKEKISILEKHILVMDTTTS